jgi:hypothetical protein
MLPSTTIESLIQILAVLYTGAANSMSSNHIIHSLSILNLYQEALGIAGFPSSCVTASSLKLLQGYIILNTFKTTHDSPHTAFGFLAHAIRYAQYMWLHVEPLVETIEGEVKKRLWWHLVILDIESSIPSGIPCIIHPDSFTTSLPKLDHDFIAMQGIYMWAKKMQLSFHNLPSKDTTFNSEVQYLVSIALDEWSKNFLEMLVDRANCMNGLRFWQLKQFTKTSCNSEIVR